MALQVMSPSGSTAELHTRCQPQQSGRSSRDPEPQPGHQARRTDAKGQTQEEVRGHSEGKEAE